MILSAVRSISRDVLGRYPSMVVQANHQKQTNPQQSLWIKSEYHDDRYIPNTKVRFEKTSGITADDDPLRCEIALW
jgi:hypothetical protein